MAGLGLALLFSFGCSATSAKEKASALHDASAPAVERIPLSVETDQGPVTFQVEVADAPEERMRGLMFRERMADGEGMVFLFPRAEQQSFWMHNTLIPLDMIFIRADRTILGIVESATPRTDTPRSVPGESQFVLELQGGVAAQKGIKPGQSVKFYAPVPSE